MVLFLLPPTIGSQLLCMLRSYFKTAVRRLSKDWVYTFVNSIGLTIGISACFLIWLIAHYELNFDRFHPEGDRIYRGSPF